MKLAALNEFPRISLRYGGKPISTPIEEWQVSTKKQKPVPGLSYTSPTAIQRPASP